MKVLDLMSRQVDSVSSSASVRDVCRLIFGRGINGVPVKDGKKLVGFVTERDVLSKFYPTIQEYIEDPVNLADFEEMEKKTSGVLKLNVDKIMSKNPITISSDAPVLRAQSLMFVHKIGRLPVVDENGNLIGILSKGDIFRGIIGGMMPFEEESEFYNWLAKDYDKLNNWPKRLKGEMPDIVKLFKKEKVKNVIDVAFSTAEHSIALARAGFKVFGADTSPTMYKIAKEKIDKLPKDIRDEIELMTGKYEEIIPNFGQGFDSAIFMGNAIPHVLYTDNRILRDVAKILKPEGAVMVFQMINFEKILKVNSGFRDYKLLSSSDPYGEKEIYFGFYTKEKDNVLTITRTVFDYEQGKWVSRRINSTPMFNIGKKEIKDLLSRVGFNKVSIYGSRFYGNIFEGEFKPLESDWLNVVARK